MKILDNLKKPSLILFLETTQMQILVWIRVGIKKEKIM